ncbi:hypothetical protein FB446DRAFT_110198 [Lentinula raphanica]|nr:hypothetical protein FB446DRAFT_110198 [Lentinula raphanica]
MRVVRVMRIVLAVVLLIVFGEEQLQTRKEKDSRGGGGAKGPTSCSIYHSVNVLHNISRCAARKISRTQDAGRWGSVRGVLRKTRAHDWIP